MMPQNRSDPTRQTLERDEDERLAPVAMRSATAQRCAPRDPEGRAFDYRTEFQRDRDRILHSRAFRRLRLKSNGGAFPPVEPWRDRLTHTLEVSQLSRTVARSLGLNEDLVEAIALGHELGAPPFGEAGALALDALMAGRAGGFGIGAQSLRVVDRIEKWYAHPGLNLTDATREGIVKHEPPAERSIVLRQTGVEGTARAHLRLDAPPFFEAQVVTAVHGVATTVQDLDDGLRAGGIDPSEVERLPIVKELIRREGIPRAQRGGLHVRAGSLYRALTHMLVSVLIQNSRRGLDAWMRTHRVTTHGEFLDNRDHVAAGTIALSARAARLFEGLTGLVQRRLHHGAALRGVATRARHIISGLLETLTVDPRLAEDYVLIRFREENGGSYLRDLSGPDAEKEIRRRYRGNARFARLIADHIAGMTDLFAVSEYERLLGPHPTSHAVHPAVRAAQGSRGADDANAAREGGQGR